MSSSSDKKGKLHSRDEDDDESLPSRKRRFLEQFRPEIKQLLERIGKDVTVAVVKAEPDAEEQLAEDKATQARTPSAETQVQPASAQVAANQNQGNGNDECQSQELKPKPKKTAPSPEELRLLVNKLKGSAIPLLSVSQTVDMLGSHLIKLGAGSYGEAYYNLEKNVVVK